jgi:enoyl-CoA hydratase
MTAAPGSVRLEVADGVALLTLDRPHVRNALDGRLLTELRERLAEADARPEVRALVLTGVDPAFCAGLDLVAFGGGDPILVAEASAASHPPWPPTRKPVVGAINGPCVAGGLELALACDVLVASERATFADTHARVGVMPGWELTVRLSAAVGRRTATWMSLTGNPLTAQQAADAGLVLQIVPHAETVSAALRLVAAVAASDPAAVAALLGTYRDAEAAVWADGFAIETTTGEVWRAGVGSFDTVEARRVDVVSRGRAQHRSAAAE